MADEENAGLVSPMENLSLEANSMLMSGHVNNPEVDDGSEEDGQESEQEGDGFANVSAAATAEH